MLKKTLKKLIATALAVATVATTMVAPVSASTLTPKKSHSEAQITEYVDYRQICIPSRRSHTSLY